MRACLDIPGDPEGGRIVNAGDWLHAARPPLPLQIIGEALIALAHDRPYLAANGAWSLTPLKD